MTDLQLTEWHRISFGVQAVQVTDDNLEAVAEWCGGEVNVVDGVSVVQFVDCRRAPRPKRISARVGEWVSAGRNTDEERGAQWLKATSFKVYKDDRLRAIFEQVKPPEVDPDKKSALVKLFFESTSAQHYATQSGDQYGADDIHGSVINRILELFAPKVGLTFEQKRDKARTVARRTISDADMGNRMATARKIADAVLEELCA